MSKIITEIIEETFDTDELNPFNMPSLSPEDEPEEGEDGEDGEEGEPGEPGEPGKKGKKGKKGKEDGPGEPGEDGEDGEGGEPGDDDEDGEDGEDGEGDGEGGEPGDDEGEGEGEGEGGEDGLGEDGDPDEDGEGGGDASDKTEEDIENANKKIRDAMANREDLTDEEIEKQGKKLQKAKRNSNPQQGREGKDSTPSMFDYTKVKPRYTWDALLQKLVVDSSAKFDDSYQKVNRKNITGMHIAKQTGFGVIKPGEIQLDSEIKLAFIVDSSGSMSGDIAKVYSNMMNLLKTHRAQLSGDFYLFKFSNSYHVFRANFASGKYDKLASVDDNSKKILSGNLENLFKQHYGDSTNFSAVLAEDAMKLAAKKYNVIVLTDTDILAEDNMKNLLTVYRKYSNQLYIIAANRHIWEEMCRVLGQVSANITYLT